MTTSAMTDPGDRAERPPRETIARDAQQAAAVEATATMLKVIEGR